MAPRVSATLLADNEAQIAENTKLYSGELRSWRKPGSLTPKVEYNFEPKSIFRTIGYDNSPMFFAWDKDVDVVRGSITNAEEKPIYYTGDGAPKKTNLDLAMAGTAADGVMPRQYLALGVPAPVLAPSVELRLTVDNDPEFPTVIKDYVSLSEEFEITLTGSNVVVVGLCQVASRNIEIDHDERIVVGMSVTGDGIQTGTTVIEISEHPSDVDKRIVRVSKNVNEGGPVAEGDFDERSLTFLSPTVTRNTSVDKTSGDGIAYTLAEPAETRAYIYTYVSVFGSIEEESAPSPASDATIVRHGQLCYLTNFSEVPEGLHNIQYIRIYRAVTGSLGTPYLYVGQINVGDTEFEDSTLASELGEVCPSLSWSEPPEGLQGLVGLANGSLAGFVDNELWFSEPYIPHAFPVSYMLTTEYPIVGLGVFGESLAVMTEGNPYIVTGTDPSAMSMAKLPLYEPCVSKRSIASDETGVMYASPNGLILIGVGGAQNSTRNMFTKEEWQAYNPVSLLSRMVDGKYIGFWKVEPTGTEPAKYGGLILDRYIQASPLSVTSYWATALYMEPTESKLYLCIDGEVKEWEGDEYNSLPYEWRSKVFVLPRPLNFGAVQIDADFGDIASATRLQEQIALLVKENQEIWQEGDLLGSLNSRPMNQTATNGSNLFEVSVAVDDRYVLLTIFADGQQRAQLSIKNRNAVRLPSGFKADRWELKLNGNIPLKHVKLAETSKGLVEI